jgi:two-component system sensor histidine kinase UhpB
VVRDVTEQRRAEQALRRTDEKYRDILRHMDEVVYVLAPAGDTWRDVRLELVSGSLERLLGYTPQEFQADPDLFFRVMHHGDRADARLAMRAAVRGGKPGAREFRLRHKHTGAYHWFEDRMIPQRDGTGTVVSVLGVARDVTARKAVDRALRASRLRLRRLSRRLLEVQEEERGRIARELHDEVGQGLTAVKMHVAALSRCPAERERRAAECAELIEQSIQLVRSLSVELRPPTLDELGLAAALTTLARRQAELAGLVLELDVPPLAHRPSPDVEQACFRIAQEACTNVLRHARASRLGIALREERRALVLTVWDDGVGIRSADKGRRQGVGLAGMRERAQLAGGTLGIRSQAGRTTVRARFPHPHP